MKYILASGSPRRVELFTDISDDFEVIPSTFDEDISSIYSKEELKEVIKTNPQNLSMIIAKGKAKDVYERYKECNDVVVIGADTGVFFEDKMIGKAVDEEDAKRLLQLLSNKMHKVITGFCILAKGLEITDYEITQVYFNNLSDQLIDSYIKSGLYKGKAGAYGIQDGYPLVEKIVGDYKNVMGFPTERIKKDLERI